MINSICIIRYIYTSLVALVLLSMAEIPHHRRHFYLEMNCTHPDLMSYFEEPRNHKNKSSDIN